MTDIDRGQPAEINVGDCRCPGSPHAFDTVTLAAEPSLTMGLRANGAIAKANDDPALLELYLGRVFIEEGIISWTFVDEEGDAYGITPDNIERLLPWSKGGQLVAEKANDLYGEAILVPLVRQSMTTSKPGSTNGSTSPTRTSRSSRRSSSKSSSRASSGIPR